MRNLLRYFDKKRYSIISLITLLMLITVNISFAQTPVDETKWLKKGLGNFTLPDEDYFYAIKSTDATKLDITESPVATFNLQTSDPGAFCLYGGFSNTSRSLSGTYYFYNSMTITDVNINGAVDIYKVTYNIHYLCGNQLVSGSLRDYGRIRFYLRSAAVGFNPTVSYGDPWCESSNIQINFASGNKILYGNINNVSLSGPGISGLTWNIDNANIGTNTIQFSET